MKAILTTTFCILAISIFSQSNISQSLSLNATGTAADASALLDVSATDKGMLVPRMTSAQRAAIASPATGLLVFDTDTGSFWFYNVAAWTEIRGAYTAGAGISIAGSAISNTGDTNASDDVTTASAAGGDVSGTFSNLQIVANAVGASEIAASAVTTSEILDGTVAAADLASGVIPTSLPPSGAAGGDLMGTYPNPFLAASAVGNSEIATDAVTSDKILNSTVAAADIAPGVIPTSLPPSGPASGDLGGSYPNPTLAPGAVGTTEIATGAVNSTHILDGTVAAADIAPGVIPTSLPPSGTAGGDLNGTYPNPILALGAVNTTEIAAGAVTSLKISDGTIGAVDLAQMGATNGQVLKWTGSAWTPAAETVTQVQDTDADTKIQLEETADEDVMRVDLAGTERMVLKTNTYGSLILELNDDDDNTFVGVNAGFTSNPGAVGGFNTMIGEEAGYQVGPGYYNTAVGYQAMWGVSSAFPIGNTAVGYHALYLADVGGNTAVGYNALRSSYDGSSNVAVGFDALRNNYYGNGNVAIGYEAAELADEYTGCTYLGDHADNNSTTNRENSMALGNDATVSANNQVRIGNSSVTSIGGYADWTNVSDERFKTSVAEDVAGLDFILRLRPVSYQLDVNGIAKVLNEDRFTVKPEPFTVAARAEKSAARQTGFIAQEVERAAKEAGFDFSGVDAPQNEDSFYGLRYAQFTVPLVKAVQEQQEEIGNLKLEIEKLRQTEAENAVLKLQFEKINAALQQAGIIVEK